MQPSPPDLPAGLMAFLLNDCRYSAEVVTSCVLDLAEEGVLRAEPGPEGELTLSLAAASPPAGRTLEPFERVVLDRLRSRTALRPDVPLSVLLSDDGVGYQAWRKRLTIALGRQGRRSGLATRAATRGMWGAHLAVTALAGLITLISYQFSANAGLGVLIFSGAVVLITLTGVVFADEWRLTREGAAFAALRRRPGSGPELPPPGPRGEDAAPVPTAPAPGSGPGGALPFPPPRSAPTPALLFPPPRSAFPAPALRAHPLTAPTPAPLPSGQVWSSFGGRWHPVSPGELSRPPRRAGEPRRNQPRRATVTGEVVRRWKRNPDSGSSRDLICIDDGSSGQGVTVSLWEERYRRIRPGDVVRVTYNPRRMSVRNIQKVT